MRVCVLCTEKEGNVIQFSYGEKLKLLAYIRQVAHGKYNEDLLSPLGVLDVIGRDRRYTVFCIHFISIILFHLLVYNDVTNIRSKYEF